MKAVSIQVKKPLSDDPPDFTAYSQPDQPDQANLEDELNERNLKFHQLKVENAALKNKLTVNQKELNNIKALNIFLTAENKELKDLQPTSKIISLNSQDAFNSMSSVRTDMKDCPSTREPSDPACEDKCKLRRKNASSHSDLSNICPQESHKKNLSHMTTQRTNKDKLNRVRPKPKFSSRYVPSFMRGICSIRFS